MTTVAFRCDGGERVGAGHVARCLQIARAFGLAGDEPLFVGSYDGLAASLLESEGMPVAPPDPGAPLGLPPGCEAAVADSYELPDGALESAAGSLPVAAIVDDLAGRNPGVVAVDYHVDACEGDIAGPAYAPVSPALSARRRPRGFERALVTVGGGSAGAALARAALEACEEHGLEPLQTGAEQGSAAGLNDLIEAADVAVSAAGLTAYELACAGVPAALVPVAPNQERVARSFGDAGLAASGDDPHALVAALADAAVRDALAAAGPATVDGYGAFRVRDALRARFGGNSVPNVLRYRPATPGDSQSQLGWRNDPATRAVSREQDEIGGGEHERWFGAVLTDPRRELLVVEDARGPAGSVRFDLDPPEAEISVVVAPERRSEGIGAQAVREASELLLAARPELERVRAEVLQGNEASLAAFTKAGFAPAPGAAEGGGSLLTLDRPGLASRGR